MRRILIACLMAGFILGVMPAWSAIAPWVRVLSDSHLDLLSSASFDALNHRERRDHAYRAHLARDEAHLIAQLRGDRLVACQLASHHVDERQDYARSLLDACLAYRRVAQHEHLAPLHDRLRSAWKSYADLFQAAGLAGGDILSHQCDFPREIAYLHALVARSRRNDRPVSMRGLIFLGLVQCHGDLGQGIKLAAMVMKNLAREPAFLLAYAGDRGLSPSLLGLQDHQLRFSRDLGIRFMARYVLDPSGQAYGLRPVLKHEEAIQLEHPLDAVYDAIGIPYHNLDILRLVMVNQLVAPRQIAGLVGLYYDPASRLVGYSDAQSSRKQRQDWRAYQGALLAAGRSRPPSPGGPPSWLADRMVALARFGVDQMARYHLHLPSSGHLAGLQQLPVLNSGDLDARGFPRPAWCRAITRLAPFPWRVTPHAGHLAADAIPSRPRA